MDPRERVSRAVKRRPVLTPLQGALANVRRLRKLIKTDDGERFVGPLSDAEHELGRLYADWCGE